MRLPGAGLDRRERRVLLLAGVSLALAGVPLLGDFWTFVATLAAIYALACTSLVVLTGWTGQLNLHVAALGLGWGAYAAFALRAAGLPTIVALLGAGVATLPFSLTVGVVAVRFRGLELAVATIAVGLTFELLVFRNLGRWLARGTDLSTPFESSFVSMPRPTLGPLDLSTDRAFYVFTLAVTLGLLWLVGNLARGSTYRAFVALREREVPAEVAGVPVLRYRMAAFSGSIALAGTAGALLASLKLGITPDTFNLDLSFLLLAAVVIGGIRTVAGGALGGVLAAVLPELVRPGAIVGNPLTFLEGERLTFLFAGGLVLTLALRPHGLLGRRREPASTAAARSVLPPVPAPIIEPNGAAAARRTPRARLAQPTVLRAEGIEVSFGGVRALAGVHVRLHRGEICALIGPNGAGKSTLFNVIDGILPPDGGRVYLDGDDITGFAPHRRAIRGLGRTFQSVEVFRSLSVLENVMVGAHLRRRSGVLTEAIALPEARRADRALAARAMEALDRFGLAGDAARRPDELPFGSLRRLELAVALAHAPDVLLLDEPSAGLDPEESLELAGLVSALRSETGISVLLVEHDMAVVGRFAEWVYVLDFGEIVAEGPPQLIRTDPIVVERYLGVHAHA